MFLSLKIRNVLLKHLLIMCSIFNSSSSADIPNNIPTTLPDLLNDPYRGLDVKREIQHFDSSKSVDSDEILSSTTKGCSEISTHPLRYILTLVC
jgi:hypothetical protein